MASNSYENFCTEIYEHIYRRLERRDEEGLRFATKGTARKVLHDQNLLRFFRYLHVISPDQTTSSQFGLDEQELVARIHQRQLHDFLAILIFAPCRLEAARTFTREFVAKDGPPVLRSGRAIDRLPVDRESLIELFGNVADAGRFFTIQPCFSTVVIRKREEVGVPNLEGIGNDEPLVIARKDYIISNEFRAKGEREIMEKILKSSTRTCDNVLENYGSLEIGETIYSLFMPLAICDLRAYMMENHPTGPKTVMEKAMTILSAKGLAGGLNFLHTEMKTDTGELLVCYHMDLKPSNILIFHDTKKGKGDMIWKLSDFGMSRVKIRRQGQDGEKEKDFNSWFVRRQKPIDPSLSATINRRGEGTYLAPESVSSKPSMKTESDVWSLACVISVVFAYLEEGRDGVGGYQAARFAHASADNYDRFFLRNTRFAPTKVHPEVSRWHTRLIDKAIQRDEAEGDAVKSMLRYLEDRVFEINQFKRRSAWDVEQKLLQTFKKYEALGESQRDDDDDGDGVGTKLQKAPAKSLWQKLRSKEGSPSQAQVEGWYLAASESFKGCEISPDGSLVAYWTDVKISLYTSQSLTSREGYIATPASEKVLDAPNCIWKSITLTKKYLIASTTGASFQCYIFDLQRGVAVDAQLNHWYRLVLPPPEIHKVSISPDSQVMACILRHEEGDNEPGWLFVASVPKLIKLLRKPSIDVSTNEEWVMNRLTWPAAGVTQLSFSTKEDIYLVVRPELTIKSREHRISVVHISHIAKTLESVVIESKGLDSSSTAGLFTTFVPFHLEAATCAVVTREKRLHIQNLMPNSSTTAFHKDIKNYRILKLMMEANDEKMLALGTTSANHKLVLFELTVPRSDTDEVCMRELAQLPGLSYNDEFTERLSDGTDEKYVLIAALVAANRRAIYRVRLSGQDTS
ncbi:hypothetical protein B0T17DRAFT_636267 [Bombardia bombarda]|uniref:Protein kinase domain-containing protein n=1 Tax=Bombardia bombarda TaxID=252184 RepID=A0AA39XAX8_9PEZI|nr:hypothetical protein B0T17DRAFT_636267 [Bombardia bombarda]